MIRSVGYDGSIGEREWGAYIGSGLFGAQPGVAGALDFAVSVTGMTANVAPGVARGFGITDVSDASEPKQIPASPSGTTYYCVVLRRDWTGQSTTPTGQPTAGKTTVEVVSAGSLLRLPTSLMASPGTQQADQPLRMVSHTAGQSSVVALDDCRVWPSASMVVQSKLAMTGPLGSRYVLASTGDKYVVTLSSSGTVTVELEKEPPPPVIPPPPSVPRIAWGTNPLICDAKGVGKITHGLNYRPAKAFVSQKTAETSHTVTLNISAQPGSVNENFFLVNARYADTNLPYPGQFSEVDWIAVG